MEDLEHYITTYDINLINANDETLESYSFIDLYHKKALKQYKDFVKKAKHGQSIQIIKFTKYSDISNTLLYTTKINDNFISYLADIIPIDYTDLLQNKN
jgi:hypothetical protein